MSRRRVAILAVAVVGAVAVAAVAARCRGPDESAYVAANIRALDSIPVYRGARAGATSSTACMSNETPWARTVGYYTSREYALPAAARADEVLDFFRAGGNGWRVDEVYEEARALNLSRGGAYAHVLISRGWYSVSVDHDSNGCPGP